MARPPSEYASRLVEQGVPLSQVQDLLGHTSIVTTERYDNQRDDVLLAAAKRLEGGRVFKFFQIPGRDRSRSPLAKVRER